MDADQELLSEDPIYSMRVIADFPNYGVTSDGRVWRIVQPNDGPGCKRKVPYELSPGTAGDYKLASLVKDGKAFGRLVHRLVLEAFSGPCPPDHQGAHNDGDKLNNDISNLRWTTASDNQSDRTKHGTHMWGQHNPRTVLADTDIPFIRTYPRFYGCASFLSRHYGVTRRVIENIRSRETWRHVR